MKPSSNLRKQALTILLVTFSTLPSVLATLKPSSLEYCVWGCNDATGYVTFAGADPLDLYLNQCSSELFVKSLSYCVQQYCTDKEAEAGWKLQDAVCVRNTGITLPTFDENVLPADDLAEVEEVDMVLIFASAEEPLDYPVLVSRETHEGSKRTVAAYFDNRALAYKFV